MAPKPTMQPVTLEDVVSCGLIEADYGGSLKHSLGPFLIHEGDQNQTAHAQYRYKSNDIIMT